MNQLFTSYLSLGSNLSDKFKNLQEATNQINSTIGKVVSISNVYSTPSWGFDGEDFNNICIKIKTSFAPELLLEHILQLEKTLGRKGKTKKGYEDRCIDIDIILYENSTIRTNSLTIPHPRALTRKFVLIPLFDIYDDNPTPFNTHSLKENIEKCKDNSVISTLNTTLLTPIENT